MLDTYSILLVYLSEISNQQKEKTNGISNRKN